MFRRLEILFLLLCIPFLTSCAATGIIVSTAAFGTVAYEEARIQRPDLELAPIAERLQWPEKWQKADFVGDGVGAANASVDYIGEKMPDMDWWPDMLTFDLEWPSVPDVKLSSNWPYMHFSSGKSAIKDIPKVASNVSPVKAKTSSKSPKFGFNCSNLGTKEKQSECFNQFSKSLANQKSKLNIQRKGVSKTQKVTKTQNEELDTEWLDEEDWGDEEEYEKVTKTQEASKPQIDSSPSGRLKNSKVARSIKKLSKKIAKGFPRSLGISKNTPSTSSALTNTFVKNWAKAWESQDLDSYLAFYSKEFKGKKKHRSAWEASRHRALNKNKNISINLRNIRIQSKGVKNIEINFTQDYKSNGYNDTGKKELLLEKRGTGWKIIRETWLGADTQAFKKNSTTREKGVNKKLASWLKAWESQDINSYLAFYSNKFKGPKSNRAKWENSRHHILGSNSNLNIEISNLKVIQKPKTIEVNFIQKFSSDKYSDAGIKELVWLNTGSDWKIVKESWIPS